MSAEGSSQPQIRNCSSCRTDSRNSDIRQHRCPHCEATRAFLLMKPDWLRQPFNPCRGKECAMLEGSTRLQLARLASTGSRKYSPANPRKVASLAKREANMKSDGSHPRNRDTSNA